MKTISLASALILSTVCGYAQTSDTTKTKNLGNEDITVVKEYTPVVNDAFKINITPEGDTVTVAPVNMNYKIDARPATSNFTPSPVKPVRIKDDNIKKLYKGYVKGGYGLENMPLLDVYLNTLRSKNFDAGINFHHLSNAGKIHDWGFPGSSSNQLGVKGTRYFDKFNLNAKLDFDREVVHYYGYQSPPDLYTKSETKHRINDFAGSFGVKSRETGSEHWNYGAGLDFYAVKDNFSTSENGVKAGFNIGKEVKEGDIEIEGKLSFIGADLDSIHFNRSLIELRPRITIHRDLYNVSGGVNFMLAAEDGHSKLHMYPYLRADYQIVNDAFTLYGELKGDLIEHTQRNTWQENPFMKGIAGLGNTNNKMTVEGGMNVKLDHDLTFMASASYGRFKEYMFFANVEDSLYPVTYTTLYDDANQLQIKAALEYNYNNKINIGFHTEFNQFKLDELSKPLFTPLLRVGISGGYTIADKIYAKADIFLNGDAYALNYDTTSTSEYTKLNSYVDANLSVEYRYSKVLSLFATLNNLAFTRYYRWYNYPSYRFTGMIGATYSF